MADPTYPPPEVWTHDAENGGRFASINRPTAGAREEKALPKGTNPFQLHSLATPNGVKVTIMLEELLEKGHTGAEYDAFTVNIGDGVQFTSGFVEINPNSKIPALIDNSGGTPFRVFESGAILVHLAEKFGEVLPQDPTARAEVLSWVFFQVGTGPFIGGGFGHFYAYAPQKYEYPINRNAIETTRNNAADIANWPWLAPFVAGAIYNEAKTFLSIDEYQNVGRWARAIAKRPGVQRGRIVNKTWGEDDE